jgi:hypothetical protein
MCLFVRFNNFRTPLAILIVFITVMTPQKVTTVPSVFYGFLSYFSVGLLYPVYENE